MQKASAMGSMSVPVIGMAMDNLLILARVIAFLMGASAYITSLPPKDKSERRKAWQNLTIALALAGIAILYGMSRTDWIGTAAKDPLGQCSALLFFSASAGHMRLLSDKAFGWLIGRVEQAKTPSQEPEKDT